MFSSWSLFAEHATLHAEHDLDYEKQFFTFCRTYRCRQCLTLGIYEDIEDGTNAETGENLRFVNQCL